MVVGLAVQLPGQYHVRQVAALEVSNISTTEAIRKNVAVYNINRPKREEGFRTVY